MKLRRLQFYFLLAFHFFFLLQAQPSEIFWRQILKQQAIVATRPCRLSETDSRIVHFWRPHADAPKNSRPPHNPVGRWSLCRHPRFGFFSPCFIFFPFPDLVGVRVRPFFDSAARQWSPYHQWLSPQMPAESAATGARLFLFPLLFPDLYKYMYFLFCPPPVYTGAFAAFTANVTPLTATCWQHMHRNSTKFPRCRCECR